MDSINTKLSNISGKEIMGFKLVSQFKQDACGIFYNAIRQGESKIGSDLVFHTVLPTDSQYKQIVFEKANNIDAVNEYIQSNMEAFAVQLSKLKQISANGTNGLCEIEDYSIKKIENSNSYDVYLQVKRGTPLKQYAMQNGITTQNALQMGIQMLGAVNTSHDEGLSHGRIDDDSIYIYDNFRCKIFGTVIANACSSPNFDMSGESQPTEKQDLVGVGCVLYKLFNNFNFPADSLTDGSYRADLYNGTAISRIFPPVKSNGAIAEIILKAFSGEENAYAESSEFALALGGAIQSSEEQTLASVVIAPVKNEAPSQVQNQPIRASVAQNPNNGNNLHNYDNTNSYFKPNAPVPPPPKKSNTGLIITLSIVAAVLVLSILALVAWKWIIPAFFSSDSSAPSSVVVQLEDDTFIEIKEGDMHTLNLYLEGISIYDINFSSSDTDVATVDDKGTIEAVHTGNADITISYSDSDGDSENTASFVVFVNVVPNEEADKIDVDYIESILASDNSGTDYGMYVVDVARDKEYIFSNSYDVLGSSALVSLPILYTYGYYVDEGYMDEDEDIMFSYTYEGRGIYKSEHNGEYLPASDLVKSMLMYSDNNCINSLIDYFSISEIEDVMEENGMDGTYVERTLSNDPNDFRENRISAYDAGKMLYQIMTDSRTPGREFMLDYFQISDSMSRYGMGQSIPSEALFLNHNALTKTKYNEIMYVESGDEKFIVVFISNNGNYEDSAKISAQISDYIYRSFTN